MFESSDNLFSTDVSAPAPQLGMLAAGDRDLANSTSAEITAETKDLIAVRDRRDKEAFARLFDSFAPRLKGMFMRSGRNAAQAEDLVQEVMLTLWRKAEQFDPNKAGASAWVYRIARNKMVDQLRREKRPLPDEWLDPPSPATDEVNQITALGQESAHLREAIARLPDKQRDMIEKAYLGELTHQEIQISSGLPLGTIKSRIRLGLQRLRHELKGLRTE